MQHEKQEYTTPEMTVYGNVEDITAGPWNGVIDTIFGGDGGFRPGGGGGSGS